MELAAQGDISQSILRANLGALWKRDPRLFDLACSEPANPELVAVFAKSGLPNLVKVQGERAVAYYDLDDPLQGVQAVLDPADFQGARLVVVLGLGLGYELAHFFDEVAPKSLTSRIIVIEPDVDVFRHALRQVDLAKWLGNDRVLPLVGIEGIELERTLEALADALELRVMAKSVRFAHVPGAMEFQRDKLMDAMRRTGVVLRQQVRMAGIGPGEVLRELDNIVQNLPDIIRSGDAGQLRGVANGLPVILCSAGPSLQKELGLLRELQHRAILIAADGALAALVRAGIRPHLVTAVDSSELIIHHVEGFDLPGTRLVAHVVMHPQAMAAWTGLKVAAYRQGDHFSQLGLSRGTFDVSLSSGNMAFRLAQFMGAGTIILTGQDLSYAPDGSSHAAGTRHAERGLLESLPPEEQLVESNDGRTVRTQYGWFNYLCEMQRRIAESPIRVINTSLAGARIEGTEVMPLAEAAALLPASVDAQALLDRALGQPVSAAVADDTQRTLARLRALRDVARAVAETAAGAAALAGAQLDAWSDAPFLAMERSLAAVRSVPFMNDLRLRRQLVLMPRGGAGPHFAVLFRFAVLSYMLTSNADALEAEATSATAPELARRLVELDKLWFEVLGAVAERAGAAFERGAERLEQAGA